MIEIIADAVNQMNMTGSIQGALGCLGAALGVGFVGAKAVEAVQGAQNIALEHDNQEIKPEHFLYALLNDENGLIYKILTGLQVSRNPGASGKVMVLAILGMALAEAVAFYALFLGK